MKVLELFNKSKVVEVKINPSKSISLYSSIHELPVDVFTVFNSYVIQAIGIGTTIQDINTRFANLDAFIAAGKMEEARKERINMHMGMFYGLQKIDIDHICFACLVHSIDGVEINDRSEEGLLRTLKKLSSLGLTHGLVKEYLNEVKKNLIEN